MVTTVEKTFVALSKRAATAITRHMPGCDAYATLSVETLHKLCIRARDLPQECPSSDIIGSIVDGKLYLNPPIGDAALAMANSASEGFGSSPLITSFDVPAFSAFFKDRYMQSSANPSADDAAYPMANSGSDENNPPFGDAATSMANSESEEYDCDEVLHFCMTDIILYEIHSLLVTYDSCCEMCDECQKRYKASIFIEACKHYARGDYLYYELLQYVFTYCKKSCYQEQSLFSIDHRIDTSVLDDLIKQLTTKFSELKKDFLSSLSVTAAKLKDNALVILCGALGLTMSAMLVYKVSAYVISLLTKISSFMLSMVLPDNLYRFITEDSPHEVNTVAAIKAQALNSDIATDEPIWRLIIKLFMCAAVGCTPLVTSRCFSGEIWKNIVTLFKNRSITEALKAIVDYLFGFFNLPFSTSHSIPNAVENHVVELLNITRYLKSKDLHFHPLSDSDYVRCSRACDQYSDCVLKFTTHKAISDYLHNYKSHYEFVHSACVNYNKTKIRMEPVVITLYGEPGVGKTCSLNTLIGALAGEIYGDKYDSSILTYTRNPAQDFWDGYDCQPFVLYDDLFQQKDSESNPNPEVNDIIRCVNTNSFNLNMADLASKGVTYFVSEWIIATSNVNNLQAIKSIHSAKALGRRLQLNYEMVVNISFPTPEGDENCVEYLNRKHQEYIQFETQPVEEIDAYMMKIRNELWTFHSFDWASDNHNSTSHTFEEVLTIAHRLYKKKKALVTTCRPHIPKGIYTKVVPQAGIFTTPWKDIYTADSRSNSTKFGQARSNGSNIIERNFVHDILLETLPALYLDSAFTNENVLMDIYLSAILRNCTKMDACLIVDMHTSSDLSLPSFPLVDMFHGSEYSWPLEALISQDMNNIAYTSFLKKIAEMLKEHKGQFISLSLFHTTLSEVMDKEIWSRLRDVHKSYSGVVLFLKIAVASVAIYSGFKLVGKLLRGTVEVGKKAVNLITRKDAAKKIESIIEAQGSTMSGENVIKYMISRMKKNMLRFLVEAGGSRYEQGYAVIPKTGVLIFPAHFISNFKKHFDRDSNARVIFTRLPTDPTAEEELYPYFMSAQEMLESKPYVRNIDGKAYDTDLIIKNCVTLEHHDITDQFPAVNMAADGQIPLLETAKTIHIMVKPDKNQPLLRLSTVGLRPKYYPTIPNYTQVIPGRTLTSYIAYDLATFSGDCGGLVMFTTTQGYKLGGIHTAADVARGSALCALIFQEDLCGLKQKVLTVDSNLVEQGMIIKDTAIAPYFTSSIEEYPQELRPPYRQPMLFKPSRMSVFTNNQGEKVSPMKRATARYQQLHATYELEDTTFVRDVRNKVVPTNSSEPMYDRIWSFEECVIGVPGISYMDACNRSTSSGYKYMKLSPVGKKGFFGDGEQYDLTTPNCQILKRDVQYIIEQAKRGVRLEHIFRDCLKDELLKPSKIEAGDTRLFNTGPLDLQLATKMYFGAFNKMLHDNRLTLGISIGINPHVEWKFLYTHLTARFSNAFAGDFSGYDYTTTPGIFEHVCNIIDDWYRIHDPGYVADDSEIRRILFAEVYNSLHIGMQGTYYWLGNNSSGHASTADNNSMYNLLLFAYCARKLCNKSLYDIADFCIYGDDNIFVTNQPEFNLENCALALKRFGLSYGPDTKDGTSYKWKPLLECSFLKRTFRPEDGHVYAPLELTSITKTLYYRHRGESDVDRYLKYYTRLLELSQHPYHIFSEYAPFLVIHCARQSYIVELCPAILSQSRNLYYALQEKCRNVDFSISDTL